MRVKFYGVRGFTPAPGKKTIRYGGNTLCTAVTIDPLEKIFIFDAGTGIKNLGEDIVNSKNHYEIHLLISNVHNDHTQGLPLFLPLYMPQSKIHIWGPKLTTDNIKEILLRNCEQPFLPVNLGEVSAEITFHDIKEEKQDIAELTLVPKKMNHPTLCYGYRLTHNDAIFVYATDHEPYYAQVEEDETEKKQLAVMNRGYQRFIQDADILVADGHYLPDEYQTRKGWGQGTVNYVVNQAGLSNVRSLYLYHHDPNRTDAQLDKIVHHYREVLADKQIEMKIYAAAEGREIKI